MSFKRKIIGTVLTLLTISVFIFTIIFSQNTQPEVKSSNISPTPTPTLPPLDDFTYKKPTLVRSEKYNIYLIGDSMTHAFGPRGGVFSELLTDQFPDKNIEVFNYAQAGVNISQLPERLDEEFQADKDLRLKPILSGDPEPHVIIIESFGYNPLSELGKVDGLRKQEEVLIEVMKTLTNRYPGTIIMFMATIAPDKKTFSESATGGDSFGRWAQAEERIEYITSHMDFASERNIPLIDTYGPSLDSEGDGDTKYINPDDDIHPSAEGLAHMARIMVKRILEEQIFP
jgi:lysophospholipase L1-like esterase